MFTAVLCRNIWECIKAARDKLITVRYSLFDCAIVCVTYSRCPVAVLGDPIVMCENLSS